MFIIRQADPSDKTGDATKGGSSADVDFANQLFSRIMVL